MTGKALLLALLAMLCLQGSAAAQGPGDPSQRSQLWEFVFTPRYQFAKTVEYEGGSTVSLDDDFGWGFGFNYNFNERLMLGGDFGWNSIYYEATVVAAIPANSFSYGNTAETGGVSFSGAYHILPRRLTPYISGAVGWAWVNSNIVAGIVPGCYWDPWYGYICGYYPATYGADGVQYRVGAGARFDVSRGFFLKAGYNRQWADFGNDTQGFDQIRVDFGALMH